MLAPQKRKAKGQAYTEQGIAPPRQGGKPGLYGGRSAAAKAGHAKRRANAARRSSLSFREPSTRTIGRFAVHVYEIGRGFRTGSDPDVAVQRQMEALVAGKLGKRVEVAVNFTERDENGERVGRRRLVRTVDALTYDKVFSPGGVLHAAMKEAFQAYLGRATEAEPSPEPREINITSIAITEIDEPEPAPVQGKVRKSRAKRIK